VLAWLYTGRYDARAYTCSVAAHRYRASIIKLCCDMHDAMPSIVPWQVYLYCRERCQEIEACQLSLPCFACFSAF
jgi:hypothetical protein